MPKQATASAARRKADADHALAPATTDYTKRRISWKEVAEHNKPDDAWVIVDGIVYDVTWFMHKHPGGFQMMKLVAGRDVTELLPMYHPFSRTKAYNPWDILKGNEVGVATDYEFPTYKPDDGFYAELCERVEEYFTTTGLDPKDWTGGALRMIPVFAVYAFTYAVVQQFVAVSWPLQLLAAAVFGVAQVLPLLHVMHDASHTSIGHTETTHKFWGQLTLDWMAGASMLSWHHQHTMGHHVYTNVYGADPDLPMGTEPRRFVARQAWASMYQWQWLYMPVLYGLLALKVRVDDVVFVWLGGMDGPIRVNYYDSPLLRVFAVKGFWLLYRVILPLYVWGIPASTWFTLFMVSELAGGYWLAWNFEVSHISEHAFFPAAKGGPKDGQLEVTWAEAQVLTGVEYAHGNALTTFMAGALNYQIVHHLFPSISQYHYPALAPIVMDVCAKHNLPFRVEPSFWAAWTAHVRHLHRMGLEGRPASLH